MSPVLETISAALLPELDGVTVHEKWLDCNEKFPWYPLPWLMLASEEHKGSVEKAALWFTDEQRLYFLLHQQSAGSDKWLAEQLELLAHQEPQREQPGKNSPLNTEVPAKIAGAGEPEETITAAAALEHAVAGMEAETLADIPQQPVFPGLKSSLDSFSNAKKPEPLLFEPYHVVDYFASQGIKLDASAIPKDKFEKQLKSFTQWLKVMKKVGTGAAPAYADPVVEAQAVESNTEKEVITEAMAEVLEKQGKFDKAVAIYEKLLLLHPEKGPLFAARIEDLKTKQ